MKEQTEKMNYGMNYNNIKFQLISFLMFIYYKKYFKIY